MFMNRKEAGGMLGEALKETYGGRDDVTVLALARGGLPVGLQVARGLGVSLDVFLVQKLGVPGQEELAMGAITSGGVRSINPSIIESLNLSESDIEAAVREEEKELRRREKLYRGDTPPADIAGRTVILVDDGLATGASMKAAVRACAKQNPASIVVAVPVASPDVCSDLEDEESVDEVLCLETPQPFGAVGAWYEEFRQVTDDEVAEILSDAQPS